MILLEWFNVVTLGLSRTHELFNFHQKLQIGSQVHNEFANAKQNFLTSLFERKNFNHVTLQSYKPSIQYRTKLSAIKLRTHKGSDGLCGQYGKSSTRVVRVKYTLNTGRAKRSMRFRGAYCGLNAGSLTTPIYVWYCSSNQFEVATTYT